MLEWAEMPRSPHAVHDLATLVTRRHDALRAQAGDAHDGKVDAVHQARVASRRLREVVPVLGRGLDDVRLKPLRRDLRDLTRALGPVRELDVALAMVDELPIDGPDAERLLEAWREHLERGRLTASQALRKALGPRPRRELDCALESFSAARTVSRDESWREGLTRRLIARAQDLRDHIERTGTTYHPEPLHEVRIAIKKLRYVLEITAEAGLARVQRPLRTLKAAQESLGHLHDLDVLMTSLQSVPGTAPGKDLQHAAATAVATIEAASRVRHRRYLRNRAALLRVADTTLQNVVPRVRTVSVTRHRKAARGH
jgi:CHAD domain-containing protein